MKIRQAKVHLQKDEFKKFILREWKFLRDLEWFVSDHATTTKRRINDRMRKLQKLFESRK